ncbi:MAG: cytochrome c maturation protein CcmE [Anaerolineae bacterium]|nr:cytochrome c maturation protein CcmE [Anaerolineae bacterium]
MRFAVAGAIIIIAMGWFILTSMGASTAYYLTVAELKSTGPSDRLVRASGTVVGDSIEWDAQQMLLWFEIADESGSLPVVYHGPRPDMFMDGAQAVAEGIYTKDGIVVATSLLLKCPSKYEEE